MDYGYLSGWTQPDVEMTPPDGQTVAGHSIGIVVLDLTYPFLPGDVVNASAYDFPVMFRTLRGLDPRSIFDADEVLLGPLIDLAKEMEAEGVRAISGACGYFANYQRQVAAALKVPVFMSSLMQMPMMMAAIRPEEKVGLMCAKSDAITEDTLAQCGVTDTSRVIIGDGVDSPEFMRMMNLEGKWNPRKVEKELAVVAAKWVERYPEIGSIVLECSAYPPFALTIQNATRRPVFDFFSLLKWVDSGVVRRPIRGFV